MFAEPRSGYEFIKPETRIMQDDDFENPGQMIRGQKISQGQGNGFPAYRLATGEITNLRQRIQQCLSLLRAEPFATILCASPP